MSTPANFHVQGPAQWAGAVRGLSGRARRLLDFAHERHIPMTPELADYLDSDRTGVIDRIDRTARRVFDQPPLQRRGQLVRFDMLFDFAIAPLIRQAALDCRGAVLFGDAALANMPPAQASDWSARMRVRIDELLDRPDDMGRGFWNLAGFAILSDSFARSNRGLRDGPHPARHFALSQEPDPALADMLADVEPEFSHPAGRALRSRVMRRNQLRRMGVKPKEGGIQGIRLSRSLDDIGDAMASELCLPREVTLLKLAEDGFLVKHRPPMRQPKRDLLLLVMVDEDADSHALRLAICGAADAAIRLWALLGNSATPRTDVAVVRNRLGLLRTACCRIDHLPQAPVRGAFDFGRATRLALMLNSNLVPDILDQLPSALGRDQTGDLQPDGFMRAALTAIAAAPDLSGDRRGGDAAPDLSIDSYTAVAAITLGTGRTTPFGLQADQGQDVPSGVLNRLYLPPSVAGMAATLTCPPDDRLDHGYHWHTASGTQTGIDWPRHADNADGETMARLSLGIVDFALEALSHD